MMYRFTTLLLLLSFSCFAQQPAGEKERLYRIKIVRMDGSSEKGAFYALNDSAITLINIKGLKSADPADDRLTKLAVHDIKMLKIRKRGALGLGLLTGTLIGGFAGGMIGDMDYEPCAPGSGYCFEIFDREDYIIAYGFLGAVVGGGAGAIIGAESARFFLNGSQEAYTASIEKLRLYQPSFLLRR